MRVPVKNMPRLKLADLLRRRKMTLRALLDEFGITTYEGLVIRCARMGVLEPSDQEFKVAYPDPPVNSPQEGVIVLEAPPVVDDITGRKIDPEAPVEPVVKVVTGPAQLLHNDVLNEPLLQLEEPTELPQKKLRKKKEATQGE